MNRGHRSKSELSRFLVTRGIWLILLELTLMRMIMFFQISFRGNLVLLIILWAIGISMIALAALVHLPLRVLSGLSIAIIALHNLLDAISSQRFGRAAWLWDILHQRDLLTFMGIRFVTAYPVLPWIGVMSLGYCLGRILLWDAARRQRFLIRLGLALTAAFIVLRAINVYGDPVRWSHQATALFSALSFLNTTKYPPSLEFLLMTLGPALAVMGWLDRLSLPFRQSPDRVRTSSILLLRRSYAARSSDRRGDELRALRATRLSSDSAALDGEPEQTFSARLRIPAVDGLRRLDCRSPAALTRHCRWSAERQAESPRVVATSLSVSYSEE